MAQNPDWTWDEQVLALEFYMRNPSSPPAKSSQEVAELSETLRRLGEQTGATMNDKYRNPNGVYMKLMNFRRFDPNFQSQGKSGLSGGSKGEEAVWEKFATDLPALKAAAQRIRDQIPSGVPPTEPVLPPGFQLSEKSFARAFDQFRQHVAVRQKGEPFTNFHEGVAAGWEAYKPRLRDHALSLLQPDEWTDDLIGSGKILQRAIAAIEIQEPSINLNNNLVFWQNRFGHANRDHRALIEAQHDLSSLKPIEESLFKLFRGNGDLGEVFTELSELVGSKYPLLAYLFFLKDIDRYMPIQPTGFDQAFRELDIPIVTLRNCTWENYCSYNAALKEVQQHLRRVDGLEAARLIDAHSFCWLLVRLPKFNEDSSSSKQDVGKVIGGREKSILAIQYSIKDTVKKSNGQVVQQTMKNKELKMTD